MTLSTDGRTVIKNQAINVRDYGITDTEGYAKIKVLDLNKDGLDDFLAIAECSTGCLSKQNRIIAYTQNIDGTFASANVDLNIPFTYTLLNQDNTDQWSDSLGSHIDVFASKAGSPLSIHFESIQVSQLQISTNGIRGSISLNGSAISILPENITWNNEKKPWVFNYIIPTDLNNDGIVDYILVGSTFDGVKTTSNPYGQVGYISAVVSEVK